MRSPVIESTATFIAASAPPSSSSSSDNMVEQAVAGSKENDKPRRHRHRRPINRPKKTRSSRDANWKERRTKRLSSTSKNGLSMPSFDLGSIREDEHDEEEEDEEEE